MKYSSYAGFIAGALLLSASSMSFAGVVVAVAPPPRVMVAVPGAVMYPAPRIMIAPAPRVVVVAPRSTVVVSGYRPPAHGVVVYRAWR